MSTHVNVSLDVLKWISTQINMSTISDKCNACLNSWIQGDTKPTFAEIKEISRETGIPFGYFFMKTPIQEDLSFVKFRTVNHNNIEQPSRNLIDTRHDMIMIQDWMHSYLIKEQAAQIDYVGSINNTLSYEIAAQTVREVLQLQPDWYTSSHSAAESFKFIRNAISNAGTLVMMRGIVGINSHRQLDIEEFRAFCIVDNYAPLIFINSNDSVECKLFALLHEFVYICLGRNCIFNDRYSCELDVNQDEKLCNAVAAEILVPTKTFLAKWHESNSSPKQNIEQLANIFICGITVAAMQAFANKLIDRATYQEISSSAVKNITSKNVSVSNFDQHFIQALVRSVKEGQTLYTDAFRLTNTNRKTFDELTQCSTISN